MGYQHVKLVDKSDRGNFIDKLLQDIETLELLVKTGRLQDDITHIGAEQEFCLVNSDWTPGVKALEILEDINDPHFTTELGLFNLEVNLDPLKLTGDCFSVMHQKLD